MTRSSWAGRHLPHIPSCVDDCRILRHPCSLERQWPATSEVSEGGRQDQQREVAGMATKVIKEAPDGGWGWMIVLAAFMQSALVFGVIRSFGVFFVAFVDYFAAASSTVSWITSMAVAVQQFCSPLASALSNYFGARLVVMSGGIIASLGLIFASQATNLIHLYLSIGLLSGWLRDTTGSYTASFVVAGLFLLVGSLVLFGLPNALSCSPSLPASQPQGEEERKPMAVQNDLGSNQPVPSKAPSDTASMNIEIAPA